MFYNSSREHRCAAQKGEGLPVILGNPQSPPPLKNVFWVNVPTLGCLNFGVRIVALEGCLKIHPLKVESFTSSPKGFRAHSCEQNFQHHLEVNRGPGRARGLHPCTNIGLEV